MNWGWKLCRLLPYHLAMPPLLHRSVKTCSYSRLLSISSTRKFTNSLHKINSSMSQWLKLSTISDERQLRRFIVTMVLDYLAPPYIALCAPASHCIRGKSIRRACIEIASLIRNLTVQTPFVFVQGAVSGFSLFSGTLAFTGVWITFGGGFINSMVIIVVLNGMATTLVEAIRLIRESCCRLTENALWIYDPHGMYFKQSCDVVHQYTKLIGLCFMTGACIAACVQRPEMLAGLWARGQHLFEELM